LAEVIEVAGGGSSSAALAVNDIPISRYLILKLRKVGSCKHGEGDSLGDLAVRMELNLRLEKLTRGGQDRVYAGSGVVSIFHMSFFVFLIPIRHARTWKLV